MRLDLVVGPNGSGKSTFVDLVLAPLRPHVPFVNADLIAAHRWPDNPMAHAYDAATIAADTRATLIDHGEPFIAETVFSHTSKLDLIALAQAAGFTVSLHVLLVPEELAVRRVAERVANGGHAVPEEKIRSRYQRLWPLVAVAINSSDTSTVYDNSQAKGPVEVALFTGGLAVGSPQWPNWAPSALKQL